MGNLFGLDSPFVKFGNILADIIILSLLWILFSLPIITIGASTTALYFVMTRRISDREQYIFKDFFKSFKREFFKATGVWLIILAIGFVLGFNIMNIDAITKLFGLNSTIRFLFLAMQYFVLLELTFFIVFVFPTLARFDVDFKTLIKNGLFLGNRHFLTSILCIIIAAIIVLVSMLTVPMLILIAVGLYAFITSYLMIRIFRKYRPEMDQDIIIEDSVLLNEIEKKDNERNDE